MKHLFLAFLIIVLFGIAGRMEYNDEVAARDAAAAERRNVR